MNANVASQISIFYNKAWMVLIAILAVFVTGFGIAMLEFRNVDNHIEGLATQIDDGFARIDTMFQSQHGRVLSVDDLPK